MKTLHKWHWIGAAVSLVGMLLFSLTGLTLNHAALIEAEPRVTERVVELPADVRASLSAHAADGRRPLPPALRRWLADELAIATAGRDADWQGGEVYLSLPRAGGDAWLAVDLDTGEVFHEVTDRGWIALFNDLHKGRNTGPVWSLFMDVFALACVVFTVAGLVLLKLHDIGRPLTWPLVGLGLAVPLLIALFFVH